MNSKSLIPLIMLICFVGAYVCEIETVETRTYPGSGLSNKLKNIGVNLNTAGLTDKIKNVGGMVNTSGLTHKIKDVGSKISNSNLADRVKDVGSKISNSEIADKVKDVAHDVNNKVKHTIIKAGITYAIKG